MREQMGVDSPNLGPLLDSMVIPPGTAVPPDLVQPRVEPEIGIVIGADGRPAGARAVLEVVDSVWRDYRFTLAANTADGSSAAGVVVGDALEGDLAELTVELWRDGTLEATGRGDAAMGHPHAAVAWLEGQLAARGEALEEGDLVITGGLTRAVPLAAGRDRGGAFPGDEPGGATVTGYPGPAVEVGHVEPCPRRVRARLDGQVVVDTLEARYSWEHPWYPRWLVPAADVTAAALAADPEHREVERVDRPDLVGVRRVVRGGRGGPRPPAQPVRARRRAALPAPGARGARRRPARRVGRPVLLFETGLPTRAYLDPMAVDMTRLELSPTSTACPYKGVTSRYWSVRTPTGRYDDLAWSYDHPAAAVARIAGLVAFYDERVDVSVDGVAQERPRTHFA